MRDVSNQIKQSECTDTVNSILELIDEMYDTVRLAPITSSGFTAKYKVMMNTVQGMSTKQQNNLLKSLEKTFKYISKLKLSGISMKLGLEIHTNRQLFLSKILSLKSTNGNAPFTLDLSSITSGNVINVADTISTYTLRHKSNTMMDLRGLNWGVQSMNQIRSILSFLPSLSHMYSTIYGLVLNNFESKYNLIYDADTINRLVIRVPKLMDDIYTSDKLQYGFKDSNEISLGGFGNMAEILLRLFWLKIISMQGETENKSGIQYGFDETTHDTMGYIETLCENINDLGLEISSKVDATEELRKYNKTADLYKIIQIFLEIITNKDTKIKYETLESGVIQVTGNDKYRKLMHELAVRTQCMEQNYNILFTQPMMITRISSKYINEYPKYNIELITDTDD